MPENLVQRRDTGTSTNEPDVFEFIFYSNGQQEDLSTDWLRRTTGLATRKPTFVCPLLDWPLEC